MPPPRRLSSICISLLYEKGFRHFEMGYVAAMAYVLFAIILVFTLIQMKFTKGDIEY
jgi:ABC-type sugar transport system permease subunit